MTVVGRSSEDGLSALRDAAPAPNVTSVGAADRADTRRPTDEGLAAGGRTAGATAEPGAVRPPYVFEHRRQPSRRVTRTFPCPTCGAPAGEPCQGRRGPRLSHHIARAELALEQLDLRKLQRSARTSLPDAGSDPAVTRRAARSAEREALDGQGADGTVHEVQAAAEPR